MSEKPTPKRRPSPYKKGRRSEYACRDWLIKWYGWKLICRSAGSHGPVDLVMYDPSRKQLFLVQVKAKYPRFSEYKPLARFAEAVGGPDVFVCLAVPDDCYGWAVRLVRAYSPRACR